VRWLDQADNHTVYFSAISLGEIVKGIGILPDSKRRIDLQAWLDGTMRPWFHRRLLPIDETIAKRWGALNAQCKLKGIAVSTVDGLIAATALEHDLTVVTRNAKDFTGTGVQLFNPWME
jgi:predicted nucleic acid-binding protein